MTLTIDIDVKIEYEYHRGEEQTRDCPGCGDSADIISVKLPGGNDILHLLSKIEVENLAENVCEKHVQKLQDDYEYAYERKAEDRSGR